MWGGARLRLHDGARKEASPSHQVLSKELGQNVLQVGDVHLQGQSAAASHRSQRAQPQQTRSSRSCSHAKPTNHSGRRQLSLETLHSKSLLTPILTLTSNCVCCRISNIHNIRSRMGQIVLGRVSPSLQDRSPVIAHQDGRARDEHGGGHSGVSTLLTRPLMDLRSASQVMRWYSGLHLSCTSFNICASLNGGMYAPPVRDGSLGSDCATRQPATSNQQ